MVPTFPITIPSTGAEVIFRPFLVKEEKILLIALETKEEKSMLDAIIQVIASCAVGPIKVDSLSNFDIEYIFLQLRARSVNNVVEMNYRCHNIVGKDESGKDLTCENMVTVTINLDEVKVKFNPDHTKQVFLTETKTMGLNMKYPSPKMSRFDESGAAIESFSETLKKISHCIESVFDSESVYTNFSPQEIQEWIERLNQAQFAKIQKFFETMPVLAHDVMFRCPKCGYKENIHLEGMVNFFG